MFWLLPNAPTVAGVLIDALSSAIAILVGFTGLLGGAAHYGAVLANRSAQDVERMTGLGFFAGAFVGLIAIAFDALT